MTKFDFSQEITDLFGDPHFDTEALYFLKEPQELEYYVKESGETETSLIRCVLPQKKPLTFRKAIYRALRNAGNTDGRQGASEKFDKDEMGMLMLKLSADKEVELSVDDRIEIKKACKSFSDTEVYIQVKQLLFPEGEEEAKKQEKKAKKKGEQDEP